MSSALVRLLGCLLLPPAAALFGAEAAAEGGQARVTYVTSASIYVDAGSEDGLGPGDTIEILREGAVVATLLVSEVSAHRAVCPLEAGDAGLLVGDAVRFAKRSAAAAAAPEAAPAEPTAEATPATPATPAAAATQSASKRTLRDFGLRGRVGIRYLGVRDRSGFGQDLSQPALDVWLDGSGLGGSPFDLALDVRARRTYRTTAGGTDSTQGDNRVYRLFGSWHDGPFRVTLGRQFSPSISNVSIFDGVLGEYRKERWAVGVVGGAQPDAEYGLSGDVREYGAYFETGNAAGAQRRWSVTTGLIGSYQEGEINREFLYLQGRYDVARLSAFLAEELDVNRGWRKQAEGESVTLTSTFGWLRWRVAQSVTLDGGYDDRRNPRLYRDLVTPETEFDDAYRQGLWAGAEWRPQKRWLVGVNARSSSGGSAGDADSYTLNLGALGLSAARLDLRLRTTHYDNPHLDGWMYVLDAGAPVGWRTRLGAHVGTREETDRTAFGASRSIAWYGLDVDVVLGQRWTGSVALESYNGEDEDNDQVYATLGYRF